MSVSLGTGVSFGNLVTSTINPLTGGIENVNAAGIDVLPEIGARQGRKIGVSMEQPAGIARAVISSGKLAARFASGQWTT